MNVFQIKKSYVLPKQERQGDGKIDGKSFSSRLD